MKNNQRNIEYDTWQDVMTEFRDNLKIGNPNDNRFNKLFAFIHIWGEQLALLRREQPIEFSIESIKLDKNVILCENRYKYTNKLLAM